MITVRTFEPGDTLACLQMFDSNVPGFFAVGERKDYENFLSANPAHYRVYIASEEIVGACGLLVDTSNRTGRVQWIMTSK